MTISHTISDTTLASIPRRHHRQNVVVLKFGGTTVGSSREQGRIRLAADTLAQYLEQGKWVVPVFSAYRRGRSGSPDKFSVTDLLQHYRRFVSQHETFELGVQAFRQKLLDTHLNLAKDLLLMDDLRLIQELQTEIEILTSRVSTGCMAFETVPSLDDSIVTGGERLAVKILAAYLNRRHQSGKFPLPAAAVTALELGVYTDSRFGSATIHWPRAVDHAREVILGQYLERGVIPVVTGFDGIYDPNNGFKDIMQSRPSEAGVQEYAGVYRTSLGRGGSDLTATFLGLALEAEFVGFCKETPGVLTGDDLFVGDAARSVPELDYDLATEAGNVYSRAVEPVRAGHIPVHLFDPARPAERTVVSDVRLPPGLYIMERPIEAVNIHAESIPDEPGSLVKFLQLFVEHKLNVEEIRHQRSGTDWIVCGDESDVQTIVAELNRQGLRAEAHYTWYLRVVGNITPELAEKFNRFLATFSPLTLAAYQIGTKVVTATVVRNRAGNGSDELRRIQEIATQIHDHLIVAAGEKVPAESVGTDHPPATTPGRVRTAAPTSTADSNGEVQRMAKPAPDELTSPPTSFPKAMARS